MGRPVVNGAQQANSELDFGEFGAFPVIDGHIHFIHPECMDGILNVMEIARYDHVHLVSMPDPDTVNHNAAAQMFKTCYPERVYMSGGLDYTRLLQDGTNDLAAQIVALKDQGFHGLKLIEGKPQVRKLLPFELDGPVYATMWETLEALAFPIVLHVGDPDNFWDPVNCPSWARESGWFYGDGNHPSKEFFYTEVDRVLSRYPNLKLTLAHFFFMESDLERAAHFLDVHSNVCFDLTPHPDMYRYFGRNPDRVREFFLHYQDRLIYGTDLDTRVLMRGEAGIRFMLSLIWLIRATLEKDSEFILPSSRNTEPYHGLGLPDSVLEKIYKANFERRYCTAQP